ncbi:MAG TPA: diaminopimelate epimerase, partial [Syntrophales bacterium]|nr:diaminopimelate epimerase [Syntrophales bacterium]
IQGSGNDFVLIDNRDNVVRDVGKIDEFVKTVCRQHVAVGADGLILIEGSDKAHFRWRFFNADGSEVEMCGNGGRCAARFALIKGIAPEKMIFETQAGLIDAEVTGENVKLRLTDPKDLRKAYTIELEGAPTLVNSINTGVPHVVTFVNDLDSHDVYRMGRTIRYHGEYQPAGTNANFACVLSRHRMRLRTYERGVEDETLACGTGAVATALVASWTGLVDSPVDVLVKSGETLKIYFNKTEKGFEKIYLEGGTTVVYQGFLWDEAYSDMR